MVAKLNTRFTAVKVLSLTALVFALRPPKHPRASGSPEPNTREPRLRDTRRAMSQENVEVVERAVAAVNARDIERYLACCTPDIEMRTPLADIGGAYEGLDGIRRFYADIEDAAPDFRLELERVVAVGSDRVHAFVVTSASGRASGLPVDTARRERL